MNPSAALGNPRLPAHPIHVQQPRRKIHQIDIRNDHNLGAMLHGLISPVELTARSQTRFVLFGSGDAGVKEVPVSDSSGDNRIELPRDRSTTRSEPLLRPVSGDGR